jgi:hypothetical protein
MHSSANAGEEKKMYKLLVAGLLLVVPLGPAQATSRYESTKLTCATAQSIIDNQGAAIMQHKSTADSELVLHERYVKNGENCPAAKYAMRKYIPTSDMKECPVLACGQTDGDHYFHDIGHMQPLMR